MSVLDVPRPAVLDTEELRLFEDAATRFFAEHAPPEAVTRWRAAGEVDRDLWTRAGEAGLLLASCAEAYGGAGGDFRHEAVLISAMARAGVEGFGLSLHNAIIAPYLERYGTEDQKRRWLPGMATGETVSAIAMTEPHAGSDLQAIRTTARRDGDAYVIDGAKTFISNGRQATLVVVVAKTGEGPADGQGARDLSLLVVETGGAEGFSRGRNLEKIGCEAQDTSELFFDGVRVPVDNLVGGEPGRGFQQLMEQLPQERLIIALQGVAAMERALQVTIAYVKERRAFGKPLIAFQNTQFVLAECKTEATAARVFADHCLERLLAGTLDAATAAMAKYWITELQCRVIDRCLQLHGGYGYMSDYPIAQLYKDARVQRIYGGANEVMKLVIARTL